MDKYTRIGPIEAFVSGRAVRIRAANAWYIVCRDGERLAVTECLCPHAAGPLNGANVCDGHVICPVHNWPWDLETGLTDDSMPLLKLKIYPSLVRKGVLYALLPRPQVQDVRRFP